MAKRRAVVAGATGVTGGAVARHLAALGWEVTGLSRRAPDAAAWSHLAVDLADPADCAAKLGRLEGVAHLFFCAFDGRGSFAEQVAPNLAMLVNAVEALDRPSLERVALVEGTKWYGSHLGPFPTPAAEDDPRHMPPNFYFDQEDWLRDASARAGWTWTALRPHAVCGFALGIPMNLAMAIAAYGAVCRELGLPMRFPGRPGAWEALYQVCDAGLLARGMEWAATEPACAGEAFNLVNGEPFRWKRLWPRLAAMLDVETAEPQALPLATFMADKGPVWDRIVARHGLAPIPWTQVANWGFADFVFATEWDVISSMAKARRFGFHETVETEAMFGRLFAEFREARAMP